MRRNTGQLGVGIIVMLILGILVIGIIGVDTTHLQMAKGQLQNAVDAAALAGAQDLWFDITKVEKDALRFASYNKVDGIPVSTTYPGITVTVNVTAPSSSTPGQVEVVATRITKNYLGALIGRPYDTIKARAVAGTWGELWMLDADEAFPLAVSLDTIPDVPGGAALNTKKIGDTFTLYIEPKAVKNAAWTSLTRSPASGGYIKDAINDALGIADQPPGFIPSVTIGDNINLNNGNMGMGLITKEPGQTSLVNLPYIVLPVITGDPPYNQTSKVVGFIGLDVIQVNRNDKDPNVVDSITGRLVKPQVTGQSGPVPTTGNPVDNDAIARLNLGPIQLLQ